MSTYVIGDVQGCYRELKSLLNEISFNPGRDTLWFAGDLVNRGPDSLCVMRFLLDHQDTIRIVLGNHDLHLLALRAGCGVANKSDTLTAILEADDGEAICDWLQAQPLLHSSPDDQHVVVHAGIAPMWGLTCAKRFAREVESVLQSDKADEFFSHLYGNEPALWQASLTGWDRLRAITNYFTRMRWVDAQGALELTAKGTLEQRPTGCVPWFDYAHRITLSGQLYFGHWAALQGICDVERIFAVDGGCVWGGELIALRIEDHKRFTTPSVKS